MASLVAAQEFVSPEEYAEQEESQGTTFEVREEGIAPINMLELLYQCTQPAPQAARDFLVVRGFNIVDARDYRLRCTRALSIALSELAARAGAAEALTAVSIAATSSDTLTDTTAAADAEVIGSEGDVVLQSLSATSISTLTETTSTSVEAVLRVGRNTGIGIISLGEAGMCVVVRYEVPLDQENYNPVQELQPENEDAAGEEDGEGTTNSDHGHEAPLPGSIGDY